MAVIEMARPLRESARSVQFDSFAPAITVADFWAEAGAAETRWRYAAERWRGPAGTLLATALTILTIDASVLLWLTH